MANYYVAYFIVKLNAKFYLSHKNDEYLLVSLRTEELENKIKFYRSFLR